MESSNRHLTDLRPVKEIYLVWVALQTANMIEANLYQKEAQLLVERWLLEKSLLTMREAQLSQRPISARKPRQ